MDTTVNIAADPEATARAAAARWIELAERAIAADGRFNVALAGGSTPRRLYTALAAEPLRGAVDWARVHVFFGDERSVPPDHPDSNYRMARETLLDHVPIAPERIHPIVARPASIRQDASAYGRELQRTLPAGKGGMPRLHLILLGMGPDGHTASLFPDTCIQHETSLPVAAVYVPRLTTWRISLTYPVLAAADHIVLLVEGDSKAPVLARVFQEPPQPPLLPVRRVADLRPTEWFLDAAAAAQLPDRATRRGSP